MNMYYNFITRALYLLGAVRDIQMFEMNGGGVVMLPDWTGYLKLSYCHSWLPSSPVKRFVSGNESASVSLFFKVSFAN